MRRVYRGRLGVVDVVVVDVVRPDAAATAAAAAAAAGFVRPEALGKEEAGAKVAAAAAAARALFLTSSTDVRSRHSVVHAPVVVQQIVQATGGVVASHRGGKEGVPGFPGPRRRHALPRSEDRLRGRGGRGGGGHGA